MAITIRIPTPLRNLTSNKGEVESVGANVEELIDNLEKDYPGLKTRLYDKQGQLRRFVNVYVNDEDIRFLKGPETELKDGDIVSIVPAIAGGSLSQMVDQRTR